MHQQTRGLDGILAGARIALVENDPSLNRAYSRLLRAHGFAVDSYLSAEACLARAGAPLRCLVLDIDLDGMSGLALQHTLRAAGNPVPIVFISGGDCPHARAQARALGCHGFLDKPFAGAELVALVRAAVL